ncbi:MerR family transcriptional regulator [Photobacterium jeanii]|nr:MerR family transcriptional regulator [Photobacterium jeanii]
MMTEKQYAISEVSELTGVNTVTLRAWQRRYGLLNPKRTPKGHRVYNDDDVNQIKTILTWLDKGVSIGKVKPLLSQPVVELADNETLEGFDSVVANIEAFNKAKLEKQLIQLLKEYPLTLLHKQLLTPLDTHFEQQALPLTSVNYAFWLATLNEVLIGTTHQIKAKSNQQVLVLGLDEKPNYAVALQGLKHKQQGKRVIVLEQFSLDRHGISAVDAMVKQAGVSQVVLVADTALKAKSVSDLQHWLPEFEQVGRYELVGAIAEIHPMLLSSSSEQVASESQ